MTFDWENGEPQVGIPDDVKVQVKELRDSNDSLRRSIEELKATIQPQIDALQESIREPVRVASERISANEARLQDLTSAVLRIPRKFLISDHAWGCKYSLDGRCYFDYRYDSLKDFCLFCGLPHERK